MQSKALIELLQDPDPYKRAEAAIKLASQGLKSAAPMVRKLCADENQMVALAALHASWQLGEDELPIDLLFTALRSEDEALRQQAVQVVSARGEPLIPQITALLGGSTSDTKLAINLLEEIGGDTALHTLQRLPRQNLQLELASLLDEVLEDWEG